MNVFMFLFLFDPTATAVADAVASPDFVDPVAVIKYLWEQFAKYGDPFVAMAIAMLTNSLRGAIQSFAPFLEGKRYVIIPLICGMISGTLIEFSTPDFDWNVAQRRFLAQSGGAVLAFELWKTYVQPRLEARRAAKNGTDSNGTDADG